MIGLDTNILVRYMLQDDPEQSAVATRLMGSLNEEESGFIPLVVVVELNWVLAKGYGYERADIVRVMETLLRSRELVVERAETAWDALRQFGRSRADFADCLIERSAAAAGCSATMTFDRDAVKACGMTLTI